jgi:hypothetical protein
MNAEHAKKRQVQKRESPEHCLHLELWAVIKCMQNVPFVWKNLLNNPKSYNIQGE